MHGLSGDVSVVSAYTTVTLSQPGLLSEAVTSLMAI